jgi:hypothetical protein
MTWVPVTREDDGKLDAEECDRQHLTSPLELVGNS